MVWEVAYPKELIDVSLVWSYVISATVIKSDHKADDILVKDKLWALPAFVCSFFYYHGILFRPKFLLPVLTVFMDHVSLTDRGPVVSQLLS